MSGPHWAMVFICALGFLVGFVFLCFMLAPDFFWSERAMQQGDIPFHWKSWSLIFGLVWVFCLACGFFVLKELAGEFARVS